MTGSTGGNTWAFNDGVELWRSENLADWTYLGLVWSLDREGHPWETGQLSIVGNVTRGDPSTAPTCRS